MNERTADLFAQALDEAVPETWTTLNPVQLMRLRDKFAELIVRECGKICDGVQEKYGQYTFTARVCKEEIKEHFGVEE